VVSLASTKHRRRFTKCLERKFQTAGGVASNHCRCQKTRLIALSCGIKIIENIRSALRYVITQQR